MAQLISTADAIAAIQQDYRAATRKQMLELLAKMRGVALNYLGRIQAELLTGSATAGTLGGFMQAREQLRRWIDEAEALAEVIARGDVNGDPTVRNYVVFGVRPDGTRTLPFFAWPVNIGIGVEAGRAFDADFSREPSIKIWAEELKARASDVARAAGKAASSFSHSGLGFLLLLVAVAYFARGRA